MSEITPFGNTVQLIKLPGSHWLRKIALLGEKPYCGERGRKKYLYHNIFYIAACNHATKKK